MEGSKVRQRPLWFYALFQREHIQVVNTLLTSIGAIQNALPIFDSGENSPRSQTCLSVVSAILLFIVNGTFFKLV